MSPTTAMSSIPPKVEMTATERTSSNQSGNISTGESSKSILWQDTIIELKTYEEQEFEGDEEQAQTHNMFRRMLSRRTRKRQDKLNRVLEEEEKAIVAAFERRACHIPSNKTWFDDWSQYVVNNHPLFGICSFHPLNPIGCPHRLLALIASVSVGCALTCMFSYLISLKETLNEGVVTVPLSTNPNNDTETESTEFTTGMIFLFTLIPCLHSLVDLLSVSFIRNSIPAFLLLILVMVASAIVFLGLLVANDEDDESYYPVIVAIGALIEIFLSWVVFYFLMATLVFSGVLGCYRIPILGGRPHDLQVEANRQQDIEKSLATSESLGGDSGIPSIP